MHGREHRFRVASGAVEAFDVIKYMRSRISHYQALRIRANYPALADLHSRASSAKTTSSTHSPWKR
jgi:hypothetical protein